MSGILDLLNSDLGKSIIEGISGETKQSKAKTSNLLSMAMSVLMQAMKRNASSPQEVKGLFGALNGKHDGSILDDLGEMFSGGVNKEVVDDGGKILGHILGGRQKNVERALTTKSGIDTDSVGQILKVATLI